MDFSCLSARTVKNYLCGGSSDVDTDTIESHVASCLTCQQLLEKLADAVDSSGIGSEVTKTMDTIRDYKIIEPIGQGGMGTVYRALHLRLNKLVALKILKSDRLASFEANSRFAREMRLLAQLEHPQIVRALDAGEFDGQQYFVMEFVPGIDLAQFIRRLGPIPVVEACVVIEQAAGALHYAHVRKILHRDVKPSNLMISADGNIKLLDLGLAQLLDKGDSSVTETDQAVGTFAYMAPETLYGNGTASPQSDVYSLGVTLFQMLTGMRPFERPGMPVLIPDLIAMRPDVLPELNALVYRMIAIDPADRPRSMQEVEQLFKPFAGGADLPSLVAEYYRWGNRSGYQTHSRQSGLNTDCRNPSALPRRKSSWPKRIAAVAATVLVATTLGYAAFAWLGPPKGPGFAEVPIVPDQKPDNPGTSQPEKDAPEPTDPPKPTTGSLQIVPHGDVATQFLDEGRISLVNAETSERFTFDKNDRQLPPGKYALHFDSPVALLEEGQVVEVFANTTHPLDIRPTLTYFWQFPTLPSVPGYASYYGTIWLKGWEEKEPTTFELSLEIFPDSNRSVKNQNRWIKVVANLPEEGYCETAYLQIDALLWEDKNEIKIVEGFVEPKGPSITKYCESLPKNLKKDALVLHLDAEKDLVAEIDGLDLPERRISTQDFLTLFFGANNLTAAKKQIRSLRAHLAHPDGRNDWLDDINNGTAHVPCYVVSSRRKADDLNADGYSMARRDDELFGFVQLEVKHPLMTATCMLKSQSAQPGDTFNNLLAVDKFRSEVVNFEDLRSSEPPSKPPIPPAPKINRPFDLAVMPDVPSSQTWSGSITQGNRKEVIEVRANMLWKGDLDGRECRWLEFEVESILDGRVHWEAARLLVDSVAYDSKSQPQFKVLQGWIAFDEPENVYPFPSSGDLDSLLDARLQRQIDTTFDQVGIVDVLAMLFAADLKPKSTIGTLRARLAGILSGAERKPVATQRDTKRGLVQGQLWKPPSVSPVQYEFFRSDVVPFGFVDVSLDFPFFINIGLEAQAWGPIAGASDSLFVSLDELSAAEINNQKQIAANDLPNWRVWSWKHKSVDYKVWAEYAGELEAGSTAANPKFVLLADSANRWIRVPYSALSAIDRTCADEGRVWASSPQNGKQKLLADDERTGKVSLTYKPANAGRSTRSSDFRTMPESDQEWLKRLRSIRVNPQKLDQALKDWKDFVTFARP